MFSVRKALLPGMLVGVAGVAVAGTAGAEVEAETQYVFNTLSFLIHGFLVMLMAAGFAMLESGLVRTKSTATICLKNIALYSVAGIMWYVVGYDMMYGLGEGNYVAAPSLFWSGDDEAASYAATSDWFFQMVFVATTASIVSGTLAERIKIFPFLIFVAVLAAFIYPIEGSWEWGGGWLDDMGFADFAGSTLVHSCGGWAALAGAIVLGARTGKFNKEGKVNPIPGANLPLATLGTFILWFGWFGFNGGSQLALGTKADAIAIANIYVNTNMAAAAGVVTAVILTQLMYKKVDLTMALNGALAGLVSITAGPDTPSIGQAIIIGAIGSVIAVFGVSLLDKLKIDDVVGAVPVHLFAGIWGTLIVPWTNSDASYGTQIVGIIAIGAFVFITSFVLWYVLKMSIGIRASEADEQIGLDKAELGMEAYPEFGRGSQIV